MGLWMGKVELVNKRDYVLEECYWSINRGLCTGRMLTVNKQGIMDGKNATGKYTWDYGWEKRYWSINRVMDGKNGTGQYT